MREFRLTAFHFYWASIPSFSGYWASLKTEDDHLWIQFSTDAGNPVFTLTEYEQLFWEALELCAIESWNGKDFSPWLFEESPFDGQRWSLEIEYDGKRIESHGDNGYPKEFPKFLQLLHAMGLPDMEHFARMERELARYA